ILVETRDMEGGLRLVREGHRDGVTMHGVGAPRAGAHRAPVPPPRTCDLGPVTALPALHGGHASHTPWIRNASRPRREPDATPPGQPAGCRAQSGGPERAGGWCPQLVAMECSMQRGCRTDAPPKASHSLSLWRLWDSGGGCWSTGGHSGSDITIRDV